METILWRVNGVVWVMMFPWVVVWRIVLILNPESKLEYRKQDSDLCLLEKKSNFLLLN
jgi:membrane protein CcdC involved in cytochrome C biogenesis